MNSYFEVEKVVFEKYIDELSSDAFKVLLKMIYLARTNDNDMHIRSARALRKSVGINIAYAHSIWKELVDSDLITKKERQDSITYVLNGRKIRQDNAEFSENDQLRNIRVTVFANEQQQEEQREISDEVIKQKIQLVISEPDNILVDSLLKTIKLIQKHCRERDKRFTLGTIAQFLLDLSNFDKITLKEVCYKYNNNLKIAGLRGFRYVVRMAEGISVETKNKPHIDEEQVTRDTEKQKQSGEKQFAIKLAIGNIIGNAVYAKFLNNNVDELRRLWKLGCKMLRDEQRENKIYDGYNWLKSNE